MSDDSALIARLCTDDMRIDGMTLISGKHVHCADARDALYFVNAGNAAVIQVNHDRTRIKRTFPYHGIIEIVWAQS